MANVEKTEWGTSVEIIHDVFQDGVYIDSAGVNTIKPYELIPIHPHYDNNEEYIPQTEGIKIIVLPAEEADMSDAEVLKSFQAVESIQIGEVITCHKGEAHALYNNSMNNGVCVFMKYQ